MLLRKVETLKRMCMITSELHTAGYLCLRIIVEASGGVIVEPRGWVVGVGGGKVGGI